MASTLFHGGRIHVRSGVSAESTAGRLNRHCSTPAPRPAAGRAKAPLAGRKTNRVAEGPGSAAAAASLPATVQREGRLLYAA